MTVPDPADEAVELGSSAKRLAALPLKRGDLKAG